MSQCLHEDEGAKLDTVQTDGKRLPSVAVICFRFSPAWGEAEAEAPKAKVQTTSHVKLTVWNAFYSLAKL